MSELVEKVYLSAVGLATFAGLLGFVLYRTSWRWRQLAIAYTAGPDDAPVKRRWTNMVLDGANVGWNTYSGVTLVGLNPRGVTISLLPPFSIFHPPLFFSFKDLRLVEIRWLFQKACQLDLPESRGIRIILNEPTARWIEQQRLELGRSAPIFG